MKILLINPISDVARNSSIYSQSVTPLPPLGIIYLASVLRNNNIEVFIEDQYASRISNEALIKKAKELSPEVIGFSCLTTAMGNVQRLVKGLRSSRINTKIVLGNIHPTFFPEETLKNGLADIVVSGEGEATFLELVNTLKHDNSDSDLNNIKGLSYICNSKIMRNIDREPIEDLDILPYPEWSLLDLKYYRRYPMFGIYNSLVLPVQASRGCLYNCLFCSQDKFYKKPRYRKIKKVIEEIEYLNDAFNIKYIGFTDAYFPFSKDAGLEFCDEFINRKLHKKIKWFTETRVDMVDSELVRRMKEANLYLIMYGFEVGNQHVLNQSAKGTSLLQAKKAMEYTKKYNVRTMGLFMVGLPGDTKDTCNETIRFAKELDPFLAKFNIAVPFPGSRLFEEHKKDMISIEGIDNKFTSWNDWSSYKGEILYSPKGLNKEDLSNLQRKAMFSFYMRPKVIFRHLINKTFSLADLWLGACLLMKNYLKILTERNNTQKYS